MIKVNLLEAMISRFLFICYKSWTGSNLSSDRVLILHEPILQQDQGKGTLAFRLNNIYLVQKIEIEANNLR